MGKEIVPTKPFLNIFLLDYSKRRLSSNEASKVGLGSVFLLHLFLAQLHEWGVVNEKNCFWALRLRAGVNHIPAGSLDVLPKMYINVSSNLCSLNIHTENDLRHVLGLHFLQWHHVKPLHGRKQSLDFHLCLGLPAGRKTAACRATVVTNDQVITNDEVITRI